MRSFAVCSALVRTDATELVMDHGRAPARASVLFASLARLCEVKSGTGASLLRSMMTPTCAWLKWIEYCIPLNYK